ncbi:MAG: tyrosine-type recombinase/integrase, partial [Chthoniobacteraceae bacterium]
GFLQNWLHGKEVSKAKNTLRNYAQTVERFLASIGGRAKLGIAAISPKDVSDFRDAEIASGKNPNTVRYAVKHLRVPFNAARRQGIITTNPAEAVELPGATESEDGGHTSRKPFSPEHVAALLDAATARENGRPVFDDGKDWQGAILFANYTGARIGDAANITWKAIDLAAGKITFRPQKTKREVLIPIHPALESHLLDLSAPHSDKAFVFPKLAGLRTATLGQRFTKIMERAGIVNAVIAAARGTKGRTVNAFSFHSLRHKFNSDMANAGVAQEIRKKFTGHSSDAMNTHYTHHELELLRAEIGKLPGIGKRH